ncbi:uncharacterized protein LOC132619963 [Lycium barbarum]|uniref:uncharacterized protein LOC132619963 n=1 Tax=Lycium barbarum TaxID=112863 RepID=UPI00293F5DC2|nr:uncharacterized protein LOC132619963 [Lycium barbarum]
MEKDKEEQVNLVNGKVYKQAGVSPKVSKARYIQRYRNRLAMANAFSNCSGKIWCFVNINIDVEVISDTVQQLTLRPFFQDLEKTMYTTLVYAKCDEAERVELWDNMYHLYNTITEAWMIGDDFNVVLNDEKNIGGIPIQPQNVEDFAFSVNSCELEEIRFKGSPFTWWNGRAGDDCIFQRLDRMFINAPLQDWFNSLEVEHLARTGSDHAPLLCTYGEIDQNQEEIVKIKEGRFEEEPSPINRCALQKAQTEMKKYLHYEKGYWRHKFGLDWFVEGDRNTKFFHTVVKRRRKNLQIRKIQNSEGDWIETEDQIAAEAISFYENSSLRRI